MLDIGCGPGRHLAALAAAGHDGLGLDLSPVAVRLARARGAEAILRSVFADVPRAGTWATALLLDGNIGIGGAPQALLARACALVAPGGSVLVETGAARRRRPAASACGSSRARRSARGSAGRPSARSESSRWRAPLASSRAATIEAGGRWFAKLERPR